jgi:hypothetical protein
VVLGAGISSAACGGQTTISSGGRPDEAAGTGNGGGSRAGGQTGGQPIFIGNGGVGMVSAGGISGTGGFRPIDRPASPPVALPDAGLLTQWYCSNLNDCAPTGHGREPFELREPCTVDPQAPRSANDCHETEWFRCFEASFQGRLVLVNCSCMPKSDAGCICALPFKGDQLLPAECEEHHMLCGCAYTGIVAH